MDRGGCSVSAFNGFGQRGSGGGDGEDSAAVGDELALFVGLGSGVEYFGAGGFSGFDAGDDIAGGGFAGVAGGGEDDGDRGVWGPFEG